MGIFGFLKRKKSEGDFETSGDENNFTESSEDNKFQGFEESNDLGIKSRFNDQPSFQNPQFNNQQSSGLSNSDIQLLLTKLDLVNQRLEVMDRRLQIIEDIAKNSR